MICDYCRKEHTVSFIVKILGTYIYDVCIECYNDSLSKRSAYKAMHKAVTITKV